MELIPRQTRLQRRKLLVEQAQTRVEPCTGTSPQRLGNDNSHPSRPPVIPLPTRLLPSYTKLPKKDHALLLLKQARLQASSPSSRGAGAATSATLIFAQAEAGTAVCIDPSGLLLTCAHCIAETEAELDLSKPHHLLFASGTVVTARCTAWDPKRDLALLQITAAQLPPAGDEPGAGPSRWQFPAIGIADRPPQVCTKLLCIGQPGSEDLECEEAGVETGYEVLCVSVGQFRGYAEGQDVQDNEEIGALMHSCWTYWGHSGAPLVERITRVEKRLVGLHSSWDDETGMRRGVGVEAIRAFLEGKVNLG